MGFRGIVAFSFVVLAGAAACFTSQPSGQCTCPQGGSAALAEPPAPPPLARRPPPMNPAANLARAATVTVSSTTGYGPSQPNSRWTAARAVDGNRDSVDPSYGWSSDLAGRASQVEWLQLAFPAPRPVHRVDLYPRNDASYGTEVGDGFPIDFTIDLSADGVTWTTVVTRTRFPRPESVQAFELPEQPAAFVRVHATRLRKVGFGYYFQIAEIEVF